MLFVQPLCSFFPLKLPPQHTLDKQSKQWLFHSDGASGYRAMLSFLCATIPRKLHARKQNSDTLSFLSPPNKFHDILSDSYGKRISQSFSDYNVRVWNWPSSNKRCPSKKLPSDNTSQKLVYCFVLLQVLPIVYGRKYKYNHWWHSVPYQWCTWATRGGYNYATTASWQLLRCGKNTQFFHEGVSDYAHNTFKRVTEDIVLTEKHSRRIIF